MNEHDSETIKGLLEQMGYRATEDRKQADIILLNTCAIRENAEDKVFGELGHLKHLKTEKPDMLLGACRRKNRLLIEFSKSMALWI